MDTTGEEIRTMQIEMGLLRREFAELLAITPNTLGRYYSNDRNVPETVMRLARRIREERGLVNPKHLPVTAKGRPRVKK